MESNDGKDTVVFSGINLFSGGTLAIFYDFLDSLINTGLWSKFHIVLFVYKKNLFDKYLDFFEIIELPKSRKSYFFRLWYEYFYFYFYSLKKHIFVWVSMHDITPNVKAERRFVYCHNPAPFYHPNASCFFQDPKLFWFSKLYLFLYRINIKKNTSVIVQQNWIKQEFLGMTKAKKVVVAHPIIHYSFKTDFGRQNSIHIYTFIFPSFPRSFKNIELLCESADILKRKGAVFRVLLTINGKENRYSKKIYAKYHQNSSISFLGKLTRDKVFEMYQSSDCLVFPSKLETWGLPISEFKQTGKPMLVANLPYAHETVGQYRNVAFFDPSSPEKLAFLMQSVLLGDEREFTGNLSSSSSDFDDYDSLLKWILRP